jgi:hypothetical protein
MPVDDSGDENRYCNVCGWFGDGGETAKKPPASDRFNPVLAAVQALTLFRDVVRKELVVEQVYDAGNLTEADLRAVKLEVHNCVQSLVELFTALRRPHAAPPFVLKKHPQSGMVAWPGEWTDYHYNASKDPCDMLVGPCSCGAWHNENEPWVREVLARHNTVIRE